MTKCPACIYEVKPEIRGEMTHFKFIGLSRGGMPFVIYSNGRNRAEAFDRLADNVKHSISFPNLVETHDHH